ncbi:MAG TPA: ABC transporter substrate-binding protein [Terriglobales bacterium]|nr:ABC transporter substrate-binding protein [Terriglobales bacterium]
MRRSVYIFLAAISALLLALASPAATRAHYGGTLHLAMRAAPASLDPVNPDMAGPEGSSRLVPLIFDRLTTFDDKGRLQPQLSTKWQGGTGNRRWEFWLRRGVKFSDGSPLTPESVAASLRLANRDWKVSALSDSVVVELENPSLTIPAEMALSRNAIAYRNGDNVLGSGPFQVTEWQPGKRLVLKTQDTYWGGRPFLDSVQIDLGQDFRQQTIAMGLGRADLIEIAPEQAGRTGSIGRHLVESQPATLIALVFPREPRSAEEARIRDALALSIDRNSMLRVLLQGKGTATASILPNWMTGYGFLFPLDRDLARAQEIRSEIHQLGALVLAYDASDPVNQLLAERVALNAREAGITIQLVRSASSPDLRLMRIRLQSPDPAVALTRIAEDLGSGAPKFADSSADELYQRERDLLHSSRIIPLLQVPDVFALAPNVNGAQPDELGEWRLEDIWLGAGKP